MNHSISLAFASAACATILVSTCTDKKVQNREKDTKVLETYFGFLKESFVVKFLFRAVKIGLETKHGE